MMSVPWPFATLMVPELMTSSAQTVPAPVRLDPCEIVK
jgi:hypothetical protein